MIVKLLRGFLFLFTIAVSAQATTVDCQTPLNDTFCYGENENTTLEFISDDGSSLNLTFNAGTIEGAPFDTMIVFDTDGTELFNSDNGVENFTGLSFQSSGDSISFQITSDGSVSCESGAEDLIDYTVVCATCINPTVEFTQVNDCLNAPQFFVDVNITDLGSASSLEITDSDGVSTQTVTTTGVVQMGPYPNGSNITIDVQSLDDANCSVSSSVFSQDFCTLTEIECAQPFSSTYCYGNNDDTTFEFISEDGSPLNLTFDAGTTEGAPFDAMIVFDTDGSELFNSNNGVENFTGLSFQSSGDSISFQITSDGSVSCESGAEDLIEYTVNCATCTNPTVEFTQVNDCLNAPQFFVDVNITDLGSASSLEITDSDGVSTEVVTTTGVVQMGPYPNGSNIIIDVQSLDDANCSVSSNTFTQEFCTLTEIECTQPFNSTYCYGNNDDTTLEFISEDGSQLNLNFAAGTIEGDPFDTLVVFDTDGTILFSSDNGVEDFTGLSFQSSGDSISFQITSDGSVSCDSGAEDLIEYSVNCATCTNPTVEFTQVSDCINAPQFFVDVNVTDLGSASSLEITDSDGVSTEVVTATGVTQMGPYPNGSNITIDVQSLDDANCSVSSQEFIQDFCALTEVECSTPFQGTYCYPNNDDTTLEFVSEDGSLLNLTFNAGIIDGFDGIIVFDTDGSVLFDGDGDMTGLFFQSTGDSISFQITSSGFNSCETGQQPELDYTVTCATCVIQDVDFEVIDDCASGEDQFFIDVNIADLGSATALDITDNQGNDVLGLTETGVQQFGPYPNGTNVEITVANIDDANCIIESGNLTQLACPPDNNSCESAEVAVVNPENLCVELNAGTLFQAGATSVPSSCHPNITQDVWFEFTATADVHATTIIPSQTGFGAPDFGSAIYADDCGNLTELYCSSEFDNFGSSNSITAEGLTPGETYYIRVYNFSGAEVSQANGGFDLCVTTPQFFEDNQLCSDLEPFCAPVDDEGNPTPLVFPNGYFYLEETLAELGPFYDCLSSTPSEPNPAWFYITVEEAGDLEFLITQSTAFDENGQSIGDLLDVDFIAYGPFDEVENNCNNLVSSNVVDCSWSIFSEEVMTIPNAEIGDIYIIMISNFSQSPGYISLNQTNLGQPGGGSTNCDDVFGVINGCASDGVVISSEVPNGNAYQWFILDDPEADPTDTSNYVPVENGENQDYTATQSGTYFVLSQAQDNTFAEEFFTVRLSEVPELDFDLEQNLCEGESLTLDATPVNSADYSNITYRWFDENGEIPGADTAQYTVNGAGAHAVEITTEELLGSNLFECVNVFDINIQGANYQIDLGGDATFCDEENAQTINATLTGEVEDTATITYLWSTGEDTSSIEVSESGVYSVEVSVDGCVETAEVEYIFNESPVITLPTEVETCDLSSVVFDATPTNVDATLTTYEWRLDGVLLQDEFMELLSAADYGFGTYELTAYSDSEDCAFVQEIEVVSRFTGVTLTTDSFDNLFCVGEEVVIASEVTGVEGDDVTYTWFVNGVEQPNQNQAELVYEIGSDANPNQDVISLSVNIGGDCTADSAQIDLDRYDIDNCIIPEGMSPDGINNRLDLRFLADRSGISSLEIFNRFGKSVFKQNDYTDEFIGQNENGSNLVTGTYFYVIKFNQEDPVYGREHRGWIYINREQ